MSSSESSNDLQEITRITGQLLGGLATPEEVGTLRRMLSTCEGAREAYMQAVELHSLLSAAHESPLDPRSEIDGSPSGRRTFDPGPNGTPSDKAIASLLDNIDGAVRSAGHAADEAQRGHDANDLEQSNLSKRPSRLLAKRLSYAATLAAAVTLIVCAWQVFLPDPKAEIIGVLTNAGDARWGDGIDPVLPKQVIAGQALMLERGVAEVSLTSGVVVVMRGPAEIDFLSPMRVRANRGAVRARVGEDAHGFVIETPTADVTDLGTEFGVDVNDSSGATDVVVFEGSVDLQYVGRSTPKTPNRGKHERREQLGMLESGEALRVNPSGSVSRIVSIVSSSFPINAALSWQASQPAVIESVRDNLRDPNANHYYQIVNAGLRDDCRAYVDRLHEWNGIDQQGIPSYLHGADYVMTFNSDKSRDDLEVSIRLSMPAKLYILWDDRLPKPEWLTSRFELLSERIGVDEEYDDHQYPRHAAVGAGKSIDTTYGIWRASIATGGWVDLGAPPSHGNDTSMYGIAATPLINPVVTERAAGVEAYDVSAAPRSESDIGAVEP